MVNEKSSTKHIPSNPTHLHKTTFLTPEEINKFLDALDHNKDGQISLTELEFELDKVYAQLIPKPLPHHLNHSSRSDQDRHTFLRSTIGCSTDEITRDEFKTRLESLCIPSLKQEKVDEDADRAYMRSLPPWRRFRSWYSVNGSKVVFLLLVLAMMLAFGIWQMVKYITTSPYRAAFGWGVVLAKTCAGMLYPTMFFLILSMSRWFSTLSRQSSALTRIINFDLSQSFHIKISILALGLGTLHAIGHLTGSFVFGSMDSREGAVESVLGEGSVPRDYVDFVRTRPGWTGLVALGLFWLLAGLSMPRVRKWNYEVFQLAHLLMYPIIGLLFAHGTAALLQWPMLGYFMAFPTLLVLLERSFRLFLSFHSHSANLSILDSETVELVIPIPHLRLWNYQPGQFILLQIPQLSRFQWHPFTISACDGQTVWIHIKTDGDWTGRLRDIAQGCGKEGREVKVGLDGPFGAPAQGFDKFEYTILIGSGIGVTPFSGILADLQRREEGLHGSFGSRNETRNDQGCTTPRATSTPAHARDRPSVVETDSGLTRTPSRASRILSRFRSIQSTPHRRVDFHWMVRDRNHLLWFSNLLNDITLCQQTHPTPNLDINIHTHITSKQSEITTHVYRWLLEMHRTEENPKSPLTGLVNGSHFGRPDLVRILESHYEELKSDLRERGGKEGGGRKGKVEVGVFFCGAPVIGEILADRCRILSARGVEEGNGVRYRFMTEVFG